MQIFLRVFTWGIFSWSLWLLGSPGTPNMPRNWAFSERCSQVWSLKQSGFPHPKFSPMGPSQITAGKLDPALRIYTLQPQNGEIWVQRSFQTGCPLTSSFNPIKEILNEPWEDPDELGCVQRQRGGSRRCCSASGWLSSPRVPPAARWHHATCWQLGTMAGPHSSPSCSWCHWKMCFVFLKPSQEI